MEKADGRVLQVGKEMAASETGARGLLEPLGE